MKELWKKAFLCFAVGSLLLVSGCQNKAEQEPEEEQVQIITNDVYEAPGNPTEEQIKVYNELSEALKSNAQEDKIAELVAVNFAYQFFTLYNKEGKEDVGGLTFIPEEDREDFSSYAKYQYYNNYATIVSQYSKEDLPNVILHEVGSVEATQLTYNNLMYDGYVVSLTLKYKESELPADGLKTTMHVQVINNNGTYQVIAVED